MAKTRARVPAPPKQRLMASAPPPTFVPDNLSKSSDNLQDLNFKVTPDFHRKFKVTATSWGMSMKELLEASFKAWIDQHGPRPKDDDLFER